LRLSAPVANHHVRCTAAGLCFRPARSCPIGSRWAMS